MAANQYVTMASRMRYGTHHWQISIKHNQQLRIDPHEFPAIRRSPQRQRDF